MEKFLSMVFALALCGCGFLNPRPPIVEDKVGLYGREVLGTLAIAPDDRGRDPVSQRASHRYDGCAYDPYTSGSRVYSLKNKLIMAYQKRR
jgi:hypothetical protein